MIYSIMCKITKRRLIRSGLLLSALSSVGHGSGTKSCFATKPVHGMQFRQGSMPDFDIPGLNGEGWQECVGGVPSFIQTWFNDHPQFEAIKEMAIEQWRPYWREPCTSNKVSLFEKKGTGDEYFVLRKFHNPKWTDRTRKYFQFGKFKIHGHDQVFSIWGIESFTKSQLQDGLRSHMDQKDTIDGFSFSMTDDTEYLQGTTKYQSKIKEIERQIEQDGHGSDKKYPFFSESLKYAMIASDDVHILGQQRYRWARMYPEYFRTLRERTVAQWKLREEIYEGTQEARKRVARLKDELDEVDARTTHNEFERKQKGKDWGDVFMKLKKAEYECYEYIGSKYLLAGVDTDALIVLLLNLYTYMYDPKAKNLKVRDLKFAKWRESKHHIVSDDDWAVSQKYCFHGFKATQHVIKTKVPFWSLDELRGRTEYISNAQPAVPKEAPAVVEPEAVLPPIEEAEAVAGPSHGYEHHGIGFLKKQGHGSGLFSRKNWKRRYFEFNSDWTSIDYYDPKDNAARVWKGAIDLAALAVHNIHENSTELSLLDGEGRIWELDFTADKGQDHADKQTFLDMLYAMDQAPKMIRNTRRRRLVVLERLLESMQL